MRSLLEEQNLGLPHFPPPLSFAREMACMQPNPRAPSSQNACLCPSIHFFCDTFSFCAYAQSPSSGPAAAAPEPPPQHFLNFFPLLHGQGSFRPTLPIAAAFWQYQSTRGQHRFWVDQNRGQHSTAKKTQTLVQVVLDMRFFVLGFGGSVTCAAAVCSSLISIQGRIVPSC